MSWMIWGVPSGKHTKKLWKDPPFFMGKSTISMAIFNSFLYVYQRVSNGYLQIGGTPQKHLWATAIGLVVLRSSTSSLTGVSLGVRLRRGTQQGGLHETKRFRKDDHLSKGMTVPMPGFSPYKVALRFRIAKLVNTTPIRSNKYGL